MPPRLHAVLDMEEGVASKASRGGRPSFYQLGGWPRPLAQHQLGHHLQKCPRQCFRHKCSAQGSTQSLSVTCESHLVIFFGTMAPKPESLPTLTDLTLRTWKKRHIRLVGPQDPETRLYSSLSLSPTAEGGGGGGGAQRRRVLAMLQSRSLPSRLQVLRQDPRPLECNT